MFNILMLILLTISTLIILTASSWTTAWIGFEMNTMTFLPLMYSYDQLTAEAMMKYFMVQTTGSITLLLSGMQNFFLTPSMIFTSTLNESIFLLAMSMKLGLCPMYFWFPAIVEGLSWKPLFLLLTWQKLAPLILISNLLSSSLVMVMIVILSALIGMLGGLNQLLTRKILAYSSITHMSWMLLLISSPYILIIYLLIYFLLTASVLIIFLKLNIIHLTQINMNKMINPIIIMMIFLSLLSLGGMPPFLGFLVKWLATWALISTNFMFPLMILIGTSAITLYFYLRIFHQTLLLPFKAPLWFQFSSLNSTVMLLPLSTLTLFPSIMFLTWW
uniref:NADH dehydrogenase subunit 2 n=1 Tax=Litostrophus scaber TaxID=2259356 RepID=UPI00286D6219|nr:NADH dehydrogenase subunit 2 [Litostrophus scaber]WKF19539.1 NADH dehydrogenase subunit 2 [Litostrophus scaber]